MSRRANVVRHGANHMCGGSDPIPGICDFISGSGVPVTGYVDLVLSEPSLWGFWPMDDPDDTADLRNVVDASFPLAVTENSPYDLVYELAGPFDGTGSVAFDGTDSFSPLGGSYSSVDTVSVFGSVNPFTFECWAYPTDAGFGYLATAGSFANKDVGVRVSNAISTDLELTGQRGGTSFGSTGYTMSLDTWHHVAMTYDGATASLYAAGVLVASFASGSIGSHGDVLYVPALPQPAGPTSVFFTGRMSLVALYTAALDAATVAAHAAAGPAVASAADGAVLTADGTGGTSWAFPTVDVDGTRYQEILTGTGLTSTDNMDGTVTLDASSGGFDPATATTWWFPLFDSDGTAVLDGDGAIIPTLIPL